MRQIANQYFFESSLATGVGTELSLCRADHKEGPYVVVKQLVDPEYLDNLETEFEVLGHIHPHDRIIALLDGFIFRQQAFLVYEYYPHGDLYRHIRKNGPLSEPDAVKLLAQLASALRHARQYGYFHCDVKPENVLLRAPGDCVLADWDLCRRSDQLRVSMHSGSTLSMAPEVILGQLHEVSDVYSLGCLLHFCLFGSRVFGMTAASLPHERITLHLEQDYVIPDSYISSGLSVLLMAMLAKSPQERATLDDIFTYLEGREPFKRQIPTGKKLKDRVPEFIGSRYAERCITKSRERIALNDAKSDAHSQSLVQAHRKILSYLDVFVEN